MVLWCRYDQPDVQFRRYLQKAFTATAGLSPDFIEKLVAPPCFPRRFEVVGDAVLIPMNAFQPEMWGKAISRAFGNAMTSDEHATSVGQRTAARSCDRESWLRFYSALANCFGARIVVQDAGAIPCLGSIGIMLSSVSCYCVDILRCFG